MIIVSSIRSRRVRVPVAARDRPQRGGDLAHHRKAQRSAILIRPMRALLPSWAVQMLLSAMRPGTRISELQAKGREIYRREGVPDPASAVIFFHGLGLSHMDIEQRTADGKSNVDWMLEDGMVVPVHLLYPGGEHERFWLEEVVAIGNDGGKPLFSWGFGPLTREG